MTEMSTKPQDDDISSERTEPDDAEKAKGKQKGKEKQKGKGKETGKSENEGENDEQQEDTVASRMEKGRRLRLGQQKKRSGK